MSQVSYICNYIKINISIMCQEWIRVEPIKLAEKLTERRQNNLGGEPRFGRNKDLFYAKR